MKRRSFVAGIIALPLTGQQTIAREILASHSAAAGEHAIALAERLRSSRSCIVVGNDYLNAAGSGYTIASLADELGACLAESSSRRRPIKRERAIEEIAANNIQRDFDEGRTVDVAGWRLAETEAKLCGLASLIERDQTRRMDDTRPS